MSVPTSGQSPEFAIPGELYRLTDMDALVNHPDLQADAIELHEVPMVLPHIVALGHVAIAQGDNEAYDAWLEHTNTFVRTVQNRPDNDVPAYTGSVVELQFYGAINGRADAADKLHEQLTAAEDRSNMTNIVWLCAKNDINPRIWIERHLGTADGRAEMWTQYFSTKKVDVEAKGKDFTPDAMRIPGSDRLIRDILNDELTNSGIVRYGQTAYQLAPDARTKELIIGCYELAVSIRFDQEERSPNVYDQKAAFDFARTVMSDPNITQDVKLYVYNQVATLVGGWGYMDHIVGRGELEIAKAIECGEDMQATFQMLGGKVQNYCNGNEVLSARLLQTFALSAAKMYAERGEFAEAATYLSNLTNLSNWHEGVIHYVRKGGDMELVQQKDRERIEFENVVSGAGLRNTKNADNPYWDVRVLIGDYLQFEQQADTYEMRESLLALADEIGSDPVHADKGEARSVILRRLTARLLERDPEAIEIGPQMVAQLRQENFSKYLYQLFARHGSAAMTAAGWKHVNRPRQAHELDNIVGYLGDYVGMLLASKGLKTSLQ